jgi:queuine tRNA-ribosyltransferase
MSHNCFSFVTDVYPTAKRIDGRSLGACRVPAKSQTLWDAAQASSRTGHSGLPKNEIFLDGGTAQAEHRSDEPANFLRSGSHCTPRLGIINTPHGPIQTPAFIFCATKGAIKGLTMEAMRDAQTQMVLANTFHIMLSPGADVVQKLGGLAKMSGWDGPTLTDSGGYQIFSMGFGSVAEEIKGARHFATARNGVQISEDGVCFKSHVNGDKLFLNPEISVEIQEKIAADLIVAFDECTPFHVDRSYTESSMRRSHRWEKRSLEHFALLTKRKEAAQRPPSQFLLQEMYGVVQGGVYEYLRRESCDFVNNEPFFGQAIGGSLGATKEQMRDVVSFAMQHLRKDRPIHLLGIGQIADIFHGVSLGIDTFDCVHPTRIARHGSAIVKAAERQEFGVFSRESINLRNSVFIGDEAPIEPDCWCQTCKKYSRGYINHLLRANEMLGGVLIMQHNVAFMNSLMAAIREGIAGGTLAETRRKWLGEP